MTPTEPEFLCTVCHKTPVKTDQGIERICAECHNAMTDYFEAVEAHTYATR